ncbi:MAG: glucosamine-6-phosphate deaminase [Isosphaeraceae bacterium]
MAALNILEIDGSRVEIFEGPDAACGSAARRIEEAIRKGVERRGKAVLGLATGATPIRLYEKLVEKHRAGGLSFRKVSTYNLDEYYPIGPCDTRSYRSFMVQHLFSHIDLPANQGHVFDGSVPEGAVEEHAKAFDGWIESDGGLDWQLLGLGRNAHIGFNEPSDLTVDKAIRLPSRAVELKAETRELYAEEFGGIDRVPTRALTVGVAQILAAKEIVVLAFGPNKAEPVAKSLLGPIVAAVPGSLLRTVAEKVVWMLDQDAARLLKV